MSPLVSTAQASPVASWGTYHVAYALVAAIYLWYTLWLWTRARRYRRAIDSAKPSSRR